MQKILELVVVTLGSWSFGKIAGSTGETVGEGLGGFSGGVFLSLVVGAIIGEIMADGIGKRFFGTRPQVLSGVSGVILGSARGFFAAIGGAIGYSMDLGANGELASIAAGVIFGWMIINPLFGRLQSQSEEE